MNYLASLSIRIVACIVDHVLFWGLVIFIFAGFPEMIDDGIGDGFKSFVIMIGFWLLYFPLAESISGQTIGKKLFRIKVIKVNGSQPVIQDTIVRRVADLIDFLFLGLVGLLIANSSPNKQRMGDQLAKTIVVNESVTACAKCGSPLNLFPEAIDAGVLKCPRCGSEQSLTRQSNSGVNLPPR